MANDDKLHNQQKNPAQAESNAEIDHDHGNMNNGTIGGNMGIIGSNEQDDSKNPKQSIDVRGDAVPGDTGGGPGKGV